MNMKLLSNPVRSIAFFLTAIILACTFGFTVDGWQAADQQTNMPESEQKDEEPENNENTERPDTPEQDQTPEEPEIYIPEYTSRLTGLEVSKETAEATMLAFVINSGLPAYGISSADLFCEVPTEDGSTRLVAFIPESENLWKIGSITNTRGYISNMAKYFGGVLISSGSDDSISYTQCDITGMQLDLSKNSGFHYTEYTDNVYTNRDLLTSGLASAGIGAESIVSTPLPFTHTGFGADEVFFADSTAVEISLEYSNNHSSELKYNEDNGLYTLYQNGQAILDALNGNAVNFKNCLVLFADSITYDNSNCNQMVMDTIGDGRGYYFTCGSYTEVRWTATSGGIMTLYSTSGEKLTINRGTTFISYMKSSKSDNILIK